MGVKVRAKLSGITDVYGKRSITADDESSTLGLDEEQQPQHQQHDRHSYEERQQTPAALQPGPHGRYFLRGLDLREPFFVFRVGRSPFTQNRQPWTRRGIRGCEGETTNTPLAVVQFKVRHAF